MLRRSSSYKYTAANADEEDGVEALNLVVDDLEGGKEDALAVAAQVVPAATASSLSEMEDGLTWTDDYFANRTDVVAVFDLNQDEYNRSKKECERYLVWISVTVSFSVWFLMFVGQGAYGGLASIAFFFCYSVVALVNARIQQNIVCIPHLAVTATGVRYVEPPEKNSRFLGSTVHIPWEAIETIEIIKSASVRIRTSASDWTNYVVSGAPRGLRKFRRHRVLSEWKEEIVEDGQNFDGTRLDINYLLEPYRFKKLVMSLKHQQQEAKLDTKEVEIGSAVV